MSTLFWLTVATLLTVVGDYLIKLAASGAGLWSWQFALGALCYGSPALAWYLLMQQHSRCRTVHSTAHCQHDSFTHGFVLLRSA